MLKMISQRQDFGDEVEGNYICIYCTKNNSTCMIEMGMAKSNIVLPLNVQVT